MKLPDLPFRTGTPSLQSAEAVRAGNKIQNIRAASTAFSGVLKTLDRELEQSAKLDAIQRFNAARRDYTERVSALTTEFESDTSKPPEDFATELEKARGDVFSKARENISVRGQRHLNARLDSYNTRVSGQEVEAVRALTKSRSLLSLEDMATSSAGLINELPDVTTVESEWENMQEALELSPLPAAEKEKLRNANAKAFVQASITGLLRDDRVAEALSVMETEAFSRLTQAEQARIEQTVNAESLDAQAVSNTADANAVVRGEMKIEEAFKRIETRTRALTNLTGSEYDDAVREAKGTVAYTALDMEVSRGNADGVKEKLGTGDFDEILTPEQTNTLLSRVERAKTVGVTNGFNANVATQEIALENAADALEIPGAPIPQSELTALEQQATQLINTYKEAGKEVTKGTVKLINRVNTAVKDQKLKSAVFTNPGVEVNTARDVWGTDINGDTLSNRVLKEKIRKFAIERTAAIAEDGVRIARQHGVDVENMPTQIGSAEWNEWLSKRANATVPMIEETFGTSDIPGPLEGVEVGPVNRWLSSLQGQLTEEGDNAFFAAIGNIANSIGDATRTREFFTQLMGDDEVGLTPVAAEMASRGFLKAAEEMRRGEAALASDSIELSGTVQNQLDGFLTDEMGDALLDYTVGEPGDEQMAYALTKRAVEALYAFKATQRGNREANVAADKSLFKEALQEVTGGVANINGQDFLMPNPKVAPAGLESWMERQDASTLGDLYFGNDKISADQIDTNWGNRFIFVSAGKPGKYHVKDDRLGVFLLNQDGAPKVIRYKADNVTPRPRAGGAAGARPRGRNPR